MKKILLFALVALMCASCVSSNLTPEERDMKKNVSAFVKDRIGGYDELVIKYTKLDISTAFEIEQEEKALYDKDAKFPSQDLFLGYMVRATYLKDKKSYNANTLNIVYWNNQPPYLFIAEPRDLYVYRSDKLEWKTIK